ncbi:uncharacterized protein LOC143555339 [Bidens hawaiensis]|uniref:uncharacterized protein LOC143555339 n=1 Tax=Bidens hawaiensis TaxID=980011 RepID=UPI0040495CC5
MTPRRSRVLCTFATIILSIIQKILKRMHVSPNPTGKKTKFLDGVGHHGLAILSFFDDHIMVIEYLIESVFPSSARVFDRIDVMVKASESFPLKIDDFFDHDVPSFLQRVPFLDRVFKKDEKEIVVDIACHGYKVEPKGSFEYEKVTKPEFFDEKSGESDLMGISNTISNLSDFKDVIDDMNAENEVMEDATGEFLYSARTTSSTDEILHSEKLDLDRTRDPKDPIIDLFEAGWHMSPRRLSNVSAGLKSPDRIL